MCSWYLEGGGCGCCGAPYNIQQPLTTPTYPSKNYLAQSSNSKAENPSAWVTSRYKSSLLVRKQKKMIMDHSSVGKKGW